ncbi:lysozyme inhibitor LprI family protein [Bradyrhizobium sp. BR 1432]|uniref:lysozyme inhibitor LprI family protein n=1 Tax=Bradyrhizobium sp. BR 1432 TaxID=3447966 RepID=UPI003EE5FE40
MPPVNWKLVASSDDLNEGPQICIRRLRQLNAIVQGHENAELWPLALVNVATCLEWFARSLIKHLIDYSADRINPDAKLLRELKINYSLILQAHVDRFSIGDIVAMSRNFSSFDEIDGTLNDLTKEARLSVLARVQLSWADLMKKAFQRGALSQRIIEVQLNALFKKRSELVHGSPRHLAYDDQLSALVSKREVSLFIHAAIEYMRHVSSSLAMFIPELRAKSTYDNNVNQRSRLENSEKAITRLEQAIETRLAADPVHLDHFRKAQRSWRAWRNREANFQTTALWGPAGSGRPVILMGRETSINMDRLRSLESYLREII